MRSIFARPRRRALRSERGAQIVEFAIIMPVFLMLVMGALDFGRGYFSWIILTNGAREGARAAAIGWDDPYVYARIQDALGGLPLDGASSCPLGPDPADWCAMATNTRDQGGSRGDPATVRLEYHFRFLVPLVLGLAGIPDGMVPITAESTMRLE